MILVKQQLKEYRAINIKETNIPYVDGMDVTAGVVYLYGNYLWRAVESGVEVEEPSVYSASWVKWAISNKYAAIDEVTGTVTYCNEDTITPSGAPYDMVMEFDWNRFDYLAISDAVAATIRVEISRNADYSNPTLDYTFNGEQRDMNSSWYSYYYSPVGRSNKAVGFSMRTPTLIGYCRITFTQSTLEPSSSVGIIYAGNSYFVGCTLYPFSMGLEDFSQYKTDDFGTTVITKRKSRKLRNISTTADRNKAIDIEGYVQDNVLGEAVLFVGDESDDSEYKGLMILGYVDDFDIPVDKEEEVTIDFSIKELL